MITKFKLITISTIMLCTVYSCNKSPKVITPITGNQGSEKNATTVTDEPSTQNANSSFNDNLHTVTVKEILPASRYIYLNVKEGDEQFWIATRKQKVTIGDTYYYKGGLLKTNFESKEHQRMFDKIYLVTNLVEANHAANATGKSKLNTSQSKQDSKRDFAVDTKRKVEKAGSVKIAELVKNYKKYEGKFIQVSGECVKINPNIMGKNWIHLKDGSKDDYDLVITSSTFIKEGSIVTMKAKVTLNKDFGAGYTYDLILEEGTIVK